jgi:hypothetical protein
VAGVVALMLQNGVIDRDGDGLLNDDVRQRLVETAVDLGASGWDPQYGYGLVDAQAAVGPIVPQDPVTDLAISGVSVPDSIPVGQDVAVDVRITNVGNQLIAAPVLVTLDDVTGGGRVTLASASVSAPEPGTTTMVPFVWQTEGAVPGVYTLEAVRDLADDASANNRKATSVTLVDPTPPPVELLITGVTPGVIGVGTTTLNILGAGFVDEVVVSFEGGKGPAPAASVVSVDPDGTVLTVDVTVKVPKATTWDVRLTNPNGDSAVLVQALTIRP